MKKVLQINHSFGIGGVESMIVQLCNNIDCNKYVISICSMTDDLEVTKDLKNNISIYSLNYDIKQIRGWRLLFYAFPIICKLGNLIRQQQPDIIHAHVLFLHYLLVAIAVRLYSSKSIVVKTVHTSGLFYLNDTLTNKCRVKIEQIANSLNKTHVVGISQQVFGQAKILFSHYSKGVWLIHNGVDLIRFHKTDNEDLRSNLLGNKRLLAVYVGRIVPGKNHSFLIDLWKYLLQHGITDAKLVIVGDGELRTMLEKEIETACLQQEVLCLGKSNQVAQILSVCDFALFPSDYEGFSIALIEKMASSLPVITSDIPPFREVITNGIDGFVIPLSEKGNWEKHILNLIKDNDLRLKMGEAAYLRSKDFSVKKMADKYEQLYEQIG